MRALVNASRASLVANAPAILQRRVRPLILPGLGRSFDIGLYVLVSSISPLRVYAYDRALVRVCEAPFPTSAAGFTAKDKSAFVINHYSPVWTLPFFARHLASCDASAACALRRALSAAGYDGAKLWRRMETIASTLLEALRPHAELGLRRVGLGAEHAFELFRFDFMVEETGATPLLTEVNISPNLVAAHAEDGKVKAALLKDTLRVVQARLHGQRNVGYASGAATAAKEELAVAGGFRRIPVAGTYE